MVWFGFIILLIAIKAIHSASLTALKCSTLQIQPPSISGIEIGSLTAFPVYGFEIDGLQVNPIKYRPVTVSVCNVTITYNHPGWDDVIHTQVWLPLSGLNARLQGIGGWGFAGTCGDSAAALAVAGGFAAVSSDLGHTTNPWSARDWALDESSGHVNFARLLDFSAVGLSDISGLGRDIAYKVYRSPPRYTYWNGCSTGGRQGMMLAQRFPGAWILAGSPALSWAHMIPAGYWPTFVMYLLNSYPSPCVMNAIAAKVVEACDDRDGVVDGIITQPELCDSNPLFLVTKHVDCDDGIDAEITLEVVTVAQRIWQGMRSRDGFPLWYGFSRGSLWHGTNCSSADEIEHHRCTPTPSPIVVDWLSLFVAQDLKLDLSNLTYSEFEALFRLSVAGYQSIISADAPDLREFRRRGAPGVGHCGSGPGAEPMGLLGSLATWVEKGIAPGILAAVSEDGSLSRILCPYPTVVTYLEGDPEQPESFGCQ
ncbi:tannase and feruloyl esterase [Aspergillus homomorphus CBS 101889]|uniref:Carboxylic ester hydrolase n=1 Tax=Aspergillus homomorphus (strain CBS 101889) TaxID=1450537 RepID=A0A395HZJ2_ASPHC|nr:tannase and feruloyl esterase [Aspergillus homomorphus CBS 101889]RAL12905.1 tannase and feruloyl esterase [Aspergillus homomorphus CBS 101889]